MFCPSNVLNSSSVFFNNIIVVVVSGTPSIFICFVGPPYPLFALYVTSYLALFSSITNDPAYLCPVSSYTISAYSEVNPKC